MATLAVQRLLLIEKGTTAERQCRKATGLRVLTYDSGVTNDQIAQGFEHARASSRATLAAIAGESSTPGPYHGSVCKLCAAYAAVRVRQFDDRLREYGARHNPVDAWV